MKGKMYRSFLRFCRHKICQIFKHFNGSDINLFFLKSETENLCTIRLCCCIFKWMIRGCSQTTWTGFWPVFTPRPPLWTSLLNKGYRLMWTFSRLPLPLTCSRSLWTTPYLPCFLKKKLKSGNLESPQSKQIIDFNFREILGTNFKLFWWLISIKN